MKRLLQIPMIFAIAASSFGLITYVKVFSSTYKAPAGSALSKAMCRTCHTTLKGKELNAYGADLKKAGANKAKLLTKEMLKAVENLDSDNDGAKNIDEIKAGTLPGDPKSK